MGTIMAVLRLLVTVVLVASLTSCVSFQLGKAYDQEIFTNSVVRGETNQQQILQWLGEPLEKGIVVNSDGQRFTRWVYYFGKVKLSKPSQTQLQLLEIQFSEDLIVQAYSWSAGG